MYKYEAISSGKLRCLPQELRVDTAMPSTLQHLYSEAHQFQVGAVLGALSPAGTILLRAVQCTYYVHCALNIILPHRQTLPNQTNLLAGLLPLLRTHS